MATLRAHLRRTARIDENDRDVGTVGLVDDHVFELPKRPVADHPVEALGAPCSVADTVERFYDDDPAGDTSHDVHEFAAYLMIDIALPVSLLTFAGSDLVQSAFASHALAVGLESSPPILNSFTRPELDDARPGQSCRFRNPQVHAEELSTVTDGRRVGRIANWQLGVPLAISFKDTGIAISQRESIHIALSDTEGKPEIAATFAEGEAQNPTVAVADKSVGIDTQADGQVVVDGGPGHFLEVFGLAHPPVTTGHADGLVDGHASIISGQAQVSHLPIAGVVNLGPAGSMVLLGKIQPYPNRFGEEALIGFQELLFASGRLHNLDYNTFCLIHSYSIAYLLNTVKSGLKPLKQVKPLYPTVKVGGLYGLFR